MAYNKDKYDGGTQFSDASKAPLKEGEPQTAISNKARMGLQFGSVQVKADPYSAALPGSAPYPLVAQFNRVSAPSYRGKQNLDGGNIQQYSYSITSKYLKAFDYMYMRLNANYNYLPCNPADAEGDDYPGKALIDAQLRALSEAGSILGSTTFTSLAINSYAIETDLPMGSATPVALPDGDKVNHEVYKSTSQVLYSFGTFYQLVLQAVHLAITSFNSFYLKMGTMLRTGFNREVPQLNAFFGLMKKSSFRTLLETISTLTEGEYFDRSYAKTLDILTATPSRRSNSIFDPVLELGLGLSHPSVFKVHILSGDKTEILDTIDLLSLLSVKLPGEEDPTTIFDLQIMLANRLAAEDTVKWARTRDTIGGLEDDSANARFNEIKTLVDALILAMAPFKDNVSDLREALDVMARAGIVQWSKGFVSHITRLNDAPINDHRFINDVFRAAMSSATEVTFNTKTKRWDTFTMWGMYDGIPEYDTMSGGSFLTFSFKKFVTPDGDADSTIGYVPKVFSGQRNGDYDVYAYMCSRDGKELRVLRGGETVISSDNVLNRLAPLASQKAEKIRIPEVRIPATLSKYSEYFSLVYKTLAQIFGIAKVMIVSTEDDVSAEKPENVVVSEVALDPDVLAIYQIEIEDMSNDALSYSRAKCMVVGSASDPGTIGFQTT